MGGQQDEERKEVRRHPLNINRVIAEATNGEVRLFQFCVAAHGMQKEIFLTL